MDWALVGVYETPNRRGDSDAAIFSETNIAVLGSLLGSRDLSTGQSDPSHRTHSVFRAFLAGGKERAEYGIDFGNCLPYTPCGVANIILCFRLEYLKGRKAWRRSRCRF